MSNATFSREIKKSPKRKSDHFLFGSDNNEEQNLENNVEEEGEEEELKRQLGYDMN